MSLQPGVPILSPMSELASTFSALSSSSSSCGSNSSKNSSPNTSLTYLHTPLRPQKLQLNSSSSDDTENDHGVNLEPPKIYTRTESDQLLAKTHSADTLRFQNQSRRTLLTPKEHRFNKLRRLHSVGTQSPRFDEKLVGRSKTVQLQKTEDDALFEIACKTKSYNRHQSDNSTPLRPDVTATISPLCSPLKLGHGQVNKIHRQKSISAGVFPDIIENIAQEIENDDDFNFERFSDDGLGMDTEDDENNHQNNLDMEETENLSSLTQGPILFTTPTVPPTKLTTPMRSKQVEMSPLISSPLFTGEIIPQDTVSPLSLQKLLSADIIKKRHPTRRGLFKTSHSRREANTIEKVSPVPKFTHPAKMLGSSFTPKKNRRVPYNRGKSVTFNSDKQNCPSPLQPILTNHTTNISQIAGRKNYRCSKCPIEQKKVMEGLDRASSLERKLTGDHKRILRLPVAESDGKHPQLTYITSETLKCIVSGNDKLTVPQFKYDIIDCRYPYEYDGGKIKGALNLHTDDQVKRHCFSENLKPGSGHVLIFHCEFSSERAPKLMKYLRETDRKSSSYPALFYPEIYLLKGGFKDFYQKYPEECIGGYRRMLDDDYQEDLKIFRKKSKTWNCSDMVKQRKLFGKTLQ